MGVFDYNDAHHSNRKQFMILKYFLPVFMEIFKKEPNLVGAVSDSAFFFKKALREEVLSLSARILGGVIVSSVVIYALITVMGELNQILLTQVQGEVLSIITFTIVAAIGGILLAGILKYNSTKKMSDVNPNLELGRSYGIDVSRILEKFYDGLMKGMEERTVSSRQPKPPFVAHANLAEVGKQAQNM